MNRQERHQLYVPYLAQGLGAKAIRSALARQGTTLSLSTIKSDLRRLRKGKGGHAPTSPKASAMQTNSPASPPCPPPQIDWQAKADALGLIIYEQVEKAMAEGRGEDARRWVDRFFRGFQAKFGAVRIGIDSRQQSINVIADRGELQERIKKYEKLFIEEKESGETRLAEKVWPLLCENCRKKLEESNL